MHLHSPASNIVGIKTIKSLEECLTHEENEKNNVSSSDKTEKDLNNNTTSSKNDCTDKNKNTIMMIGIIPLFIGVFLLLVAIKVALVKRRKYDVKKAEEKNRDKFSDMNRVSVNEDIQMVNIDEYSNTGTENQGYI